MAKTNLLGYVILENLFSDHRSEGDHGNLVSFTEDLFSHHNSGFSYLFLLVFEG